MHPFWRGTTQTPIDDLTRTIYASMDEEGPDDERYAKHLEYLERLHKLKAAEKKPRQWRVSPDALVTGAVYIIGIALVTRYEDEHVLTSKGLGMLPSLKTHNPN